MAIQLNSFLAIKSVIDGLHGATGSFGPDGTGAEAAVQRIQRAPFNDLVSGIDDTDWDIVSGLRLETFVAGDCDALTDDIKASIWMDTLATTKKYWHAFPLLPNPFPGDRFTQPDMDCQRTSVADLSVALINAWVKAQG